MGRFIGRFTPGWVGGRVSLQLVDGLVKNVVGEWVDGSVYSWMVG